MITKLLILYIKDLRTNKDWQFGRTAVSTKLNLILSKYNFGQLLTDKKKKAEGKRAAEKCKYHT